MVHICAILVLLATTLEVYKTKHMFQFFFFCIKISYILHISINIGWPTVTYVTPTPPPLALLPPVSPTTPQPTTIPTTVTTLSPSTNPPITYPTHSPVLPPTAIPSQAPFQTPSQTPSQTPLQISSQAPSVAPSQIPTETTNEAITGAFFLGNCLSFARMNVVYLFFFLFA